MNNKMQIYKNPEFGCMRTVEIGGKPYFVANDVAKALGYSNPSKATNDHCKSAMKMWGNDSLGRPTEFKVIPEGDIYRLIVKSQLPSAERFEAWVFDEVLPSIRKHGMYAEDELLDNPDLLISVAQKLKEERERNKKLSEENERMKPKEIFSDAVSASESAMLVRDVAKLIKQNGVPLGEKRFYKWLRENGFICKGTTSPTQKAMELGLFEVVVRTVERGDRLPLETKTTKITGKGQQYFINKFLRRD